jgi:hypothetical protein
MRKGGFKLIAEALEMNHYSAVASSIRRMKKRIRQEITQSLA